MDWGIRGDSIYLAHIHDFQGFNLFFRSACQAQGSWRKAQGKAKTVKPEPQRKVFIEFKIPNFF